MTALADLQALFEGFVVRGNDAAAVFVGDETASAEARLGIYYDAYRLRLIETLRVDFPGLCALMSAEEFDSLGLRYLEKHPSHYPNVRWFGRHMAEFLAVDSFFAERPYLTEMARFEWARGLAFDAANVDGPTPDELAPLLAELPAEDWASLCLKFHPALQRSEFAWNVGPIWRAVSAEESIPPTVKLSKPEQWAVWRRGVTVYWRSLDESEAYALDAFCDGRNFADVCAGLCAWIAEEDVPARMAAMLRQWVAEGLVAKATPRARNTARSS